MREQDLYIKFVLYTVFVGCFFLVIISWIVYSILIDFCVFLLPRTPTKMITIYAFLLSCYEAGHLGGYVG